ncbi:helix-turn-helix domain-containing protein [Candidatus Vondammii sp. HM_W22]|uniref:helix-turn-helix domain-containing protein n=1 Tax=Candidatus Vondammii sp. HM_W22 TaxID=2687299 RepID=UPI001F12A410|nr:helix-turn-helix transcriptional regulator [Candidatus Vondammii sp. HM_W22]
MKNKIPTKKYPREDWHPADIKAALEKAGWSLSRLSIHHGYASRNTLKHALQRSWPKGQRLIAQAIGVPPEKIWPSRYRKHSPDASKKSNPKQRRRRVEG